VAGKAELVVGDVRHRRTVGYVLQGVDVVYHFAAHQHCLPDFSRFFAVNAVGTALLYKVIARQKLPVRKVIVASSQAVFGEGRYRCRTHGVLTPPMRPDEQLREGRWAQECPKCGERMRAVPTPEEVANPQNQYALSKHAQEMIALNLGRRFGIPTVALRYSIVQGARQSFNTYSGALRIFCQHLRAGLQPTIYEDGLQVRDDVDIEDVVAANLMVLDDDRANNQVLNVRGGKPYTVLELYRMAEDEVGVHLEPKVGDCYRYGDTRHIVSDIGRISALGWVPRKPIRESVREYWAHARHERTGNLATAARHMSRLGVVREVRRQAGGRK
jgi:dTDP-L-rhamnose 4-epimerase